LRESDSTVAASVDDLEQETALPLIPFDGSLRVTEWGRKESHTTETEEDSMNFQKSISKLTRIAAIAILALSVSSANAQAWRPGGMTPTHKQTASAQPISFGTLLYLLLLSVGRMG